MTFLQDLVENEFSTYLSHNSSPKSTQAYEFLRLASGTANSWRPKHDRSSLKDSIMCPYPKFV